MNMISTGTFLPEMDASTKQATLAEKFAGVWEKKNAKAARAGGVSLMALSLAACGSDDATTTATATTTTTTTTTTTAVTAVAVQATTGVDAMTGTTADDSYTMQMDATAALNTAGVLDSIAAGTGTDTLVLVNTTANAAETGISAANITGVEVLDYRSTNGGNLDMDAIASVTSLKLTNAAGAVDVSNLATTDTVEIIRGGATQDSTLTYKAAGVTGTADSATVTLNGVTAGADFAFVGAVETMTFNVTADVSVADLDLAAGTTAVTINATGGDLTVTNQLTNAGVKTYTVTGSGDVDTNAITLGAAVTKYDAGTATGDQDLIAPATVITITTGAGADDVDMAATLTTTDTINLGAGDDVLRVDLDSLAAGTTDHSITNVETLRLTDTDANAGALNMDNLAFTTIQIDGDEATDNTGIITLTDIATTITNYTFVGGGTASADQFFNGVVFDYDTTTTQAAATITVGNGAGGDADDLLINKLDMDRMEKITITGNDTGTAAADELTITEIEGDHFTDLLVVSDGEVIISNIDGAVVDTIDLSAASGGSTVTLSDSATAVTVTLGAGKDTFTQSDTAGGLTINLGAGADTFTGASAAIDTITTGAGNDDIISNDFDFEDIVTDFSVGADTYSIDLSIFETANEIGAHAATIDLVDGNAATIAAGNFLTTEEVSGAETIAAGDQLLILVGANYTQTTALTAVEASGGRALTMGTVLADDDAILILYSDGTDWTLGALHNTSGGAQGAVALAASEVALVDLVTFKGLGTLDAGDYDATMFDIIA
jgi:S-layer protein